jgi:uncharacterized protein
MEVTLVSPNQECDKCTTMYERLTNIKMKYPEIHLKKISYEKNQKGFLNYTTPIIMIDDCVISSGRVISEESLEEFITTQLSFKQCGCGCEQKVTQTIEQADISTSGTRWHIFPYKEKYLGLDVNTSRCLEMDDYALRVFQGEVAREGEMGDAVKEYNTLQYIDYFSHEDFSREIPDTEMVVRSINLTIPNVCNLDCEYCYSKDHHVNISKEQIFQLIDRIIERFIAPSPNKRFIFNFSLFGEVLMHIPLLKELKEYLEQWGNQNGKRLSSRFNATNATLLTAEKSRQLWELSDMGEINISIDGPQYIQDEVRHFSNGAGTYHVIEQYVKDCNATWPTVASAVLNGKYPHVTEVFLHLYNLGFRLIRIKPIRAGYDNPFAITKDNVNFVKEEYTKFIQFLLSQDDAQLLHYLFCIDGDDLFGRFFYTIFKGIVTKYRCPALRDTIVVNSIGDIYSCQSVIGFKEFKVGNVFEENNVWNEKRNTLLHKMHVHLKEKCTKCWAIKVCGGGCAHAAWLNNQSFDIPDLVKCELVRHVIEQAMILLSEIRNRPMVSEVFDSKFRKRSPQVVLPAAVSRYTNQSPLVNSSVWDKANVISLNRKEQLRGAIYGTQNFTGQIYNLWDENYFYLKINILDGNLTTEKPLQENLVRFCLKSDTNNMPWEYGIGYDNGQPVLYRLYMKDTTKDFLGNVDEAKISIERNGNSLVYQVAVPWTEFGIQPGAGQTLRFNTVLYERERPYPFAAQWWWEWSPGMVVEMDPNLFGKLVLSA